MSVNAFAHDFVVDGIYYEKISDNKVAVTYRGAKRDSYKNEYWGDVKIPEIIDHEGKKYSVTAISNGAFYDCSGMISIEIPNSVSSIGSSAFYNCSYLTSVTIPNAITTIHDATFYNCSSLTSATLPNTITSISDNAFYNCSSLTFVDIPKSVTSIGKAAFSKCMGLVSIRIPPSVTSIGKAAFSKCTGLTSIRISSSVTSIGEEAFSQCTSLKSIDLPDKITSIEKSTFYGCKSLTSIKIPNSITSIGTEAFSQCISLLSLNIPTSVISIDNYAFKGCSSLPSVTIPNSVTFIGIGAFSYCSALASIEIPNSLSSIKKDTFFNCSALASVKIPNSVTEIGKGAFKNCSSLETIEIPSSVKSLGSDALEYTSLQSLTIPESVTEIIGGYKEFHLTGCDKLKCLYFLSKACSVKGSALYKEAGLIGTSALETLYWNSPSLPYWVRSSCSVTLGESCGEFNGHDYYGNLTIEEGTTLKVFDYETRSFSNGGPVMIYDCIVSSVKIDRLNIERTTRIKDFNNDNFKFIPRELVLGGNIADCTEYISTDMITSLESKAFVPPVIPVFSEDQYVKITPIVPDEAIERYKQAPVWKEFWTHKADVEGVAADTQKTVVGTYDLNGRAVADDYSGIAIVRYSDGSTKKIVAKP